jgi:flagellar hook-length control protein FliK
MTDIVNLGPPLKAMPDVRTSTKKSQDTPAEKGQGSFDDVLKAKANSKSREVTGPPGKQMVSTQKNEKKMDTREAEPSEEVPKIKGEEKLQALKASLSERQRVMQKFMDSVESEFSIPPERIVEAMTQLSDEDLLKAPEESVSQVIDKLDLGPLESEKAEAMYLAMLQQLSGTLPMVKDPAPMAPQTKTFLQSALVGSAPLALAHQERRQLLNESLDKMNSRFFGKPEAILQTEDSVLKTSEPIFDSSKINVNSTSSKLAQPDLEAVKLTLQNQSPEAQAKLAMMQKELTPAKDLTAADLRDALAVLGGVAGGAEALSSVLKEDPENLKALQMEQELNSAKLGLSGAASPPAVQQKTGQSFFDTMNFGSSTKKGFNRKEDTESVVDSGSPSSSFSTALSGDPIAAGSIKEHLGTERLSAHAGLAGATAGLQSNEGRSQLTGDRDSNVQALMKQAQYMIKKGGGEAVLKMTPEGLGEVHLKVIINEGKVNVEMKTESNEAKKMIEGSLGDLKNSLSVHKLAVDHVKVDVGNNLSSQSDQQKPQDPNSFRQDQGREQARHFFNQFHEDNHSRREPFYETTGVKAYSRGQPVQPLKSAEETAAMQARRYKGSGKGSGLDLVA